MEGFLYLDTVLRYYLSIDPDTLPDAAWAHTIKYLLEIRRMEAKANNGK